MTLLATDVSAKWRYFEARDGSPFLYTGEMYANFQSEGNLPLLNDKEEIFDSGKLRG